MSTIDLVYLKDFEPVDIEHTQAQQPVSRFFLLVNRSIDGLKQ
jgi:hypothetical protein